ncbi:MAG TPA: DJ-1/PfpI family protein [Xanthobacteraceae bacterium]|nr:DJ-1/PfpI family protein [Xanthobacteraceae bacterium]
MGEPLQIGLLIFPKITQLDMTGPYEAFARIPGVKVHLIWKRIEPITSDVGMPLLPTMTLRECPPLDVICIPGGPGQVDLMDDEEIIAFVRRQGLQARYVTSVCTGALVLGAAGLLDGYNATTHWASIDNLEHFGATPVNTRVCVDRNRITGGGITAGLDFGLYLASVLADRETAERIQLFLEYTPEPPFTSGSPATASKAVVERLSAAIAPMLSRRKEATLRAAQRLKSTTS